MRIDCHTHTACHSSCSTLRPTELLELAQLRSIDAVVFTEHSYQWPPKDLEPLRKSFPHLAVYGGVEYSLAEGYDVVVISPGLDRDMPPFPTLERLMRGMESVREDAFCFVAHAFRYSNDLSPQLSRILDVVDGMEMNSINILRTRAQLTTQGYRPANWQCYEDAAERFRPIRVWNTDSHHSPAVGAFATVFDMDEPPPDEAALARLLKSTQGRPWQNTQVIENYLDWR